MKRVFHLMPALNYGGTETVVASLCRYQINTLGYDSRIILFGENNRMDISSDIQVIQILNCNASLGWLGNKMVGVEKLIELIKVEKPDVIHSHSEWTTLIALSCKIKSVKYIFHYHRYFSKPKVRRSALTRFSENVLVTFLLTRFGNSKIIAVSEKLKGQIFHLYPILRLYKNMVQVVGNPIPSARNGKPVPLAVKNPFLILTVSRLEHEKNIFAIISIAEKLESLMPFIWEIYGSGNQSELFDKKVQAANLKNRIILKGVTNDLTNVYPKYDVYVSVSNCETFGLTILESLSQGIPVIARKNGGSNDFLVNKLNAIYLDTDNPNKFAKAIHDISFDEKVKSIRLNGLKTASRYFINSIGQKIDLIYKSG
ncbi:MAG TPA: glycosyltransferase [Cyclobacteriaceae bacterium]|jgi:glycosyltransferase involved in cell wall biosynthesis